MNESAWKAFDLAQLVEKCDARGAPYLEFLRVPQLSCGIYALAAGAKDTQSTHDEDEVYVVLKGRAELVVDGEEIALRPTFHTNSSGSKKIYRCSSFSAPGAPRAPKSRRERPSHDRARI